MRTSSMWIRLSEYRGRSRYVNAAYFVCVFFVCDVIITLTYDPNRMAPGNVIVDMLVAVTVSLLEFEIHRFTSTMGKKGSKAETEIH